MKYLFSLLLLLTLFTPSRSFAQRQVPVTPTPTPPVNECATISLANYDTCCRSFRDVLTATSCQRYVASNLDSICRNVGIGSPAEIYTTCCVQNNHPSCSPQGGVGSGTGLPGGSTLPGRPTFGTPQVNSTTANAPAISTECSSVIGPTGKLRSFLDVLLWVRCVISTYLLPIIFSVAFLIFMYGVIKYVIAGDVKDKEEGKKFLMWGLIGLFVMVSVWGIVALVSNTLGLENTVPQLQQNVFCEGGKKWDPVTQRCR